MSASLCPLDRHYTARELPCPRCGATCADSSGGLTFNRGTCDHYLCTDCVLREAVRAAVSSKLKRARGCCIGGSGAEAVAGYGGDTFCSNVMQVKVSCPIRHCRFGTFHVDRTLVKAQLEHHQQQSDEGVIDLCGDDDGTAIKTGKNAEGEGKPANNNIKTKEGAVMTTSHVAVKRENADGGLASAQIAAASNRVDIKYEEYCTKEEDTEDEGANYYAVAPTSKKMRIDSPSTAESQPRTNPNIVSPPPVTKKFNLKPIFDAGDEVYAAWWDKRDRHRRKQPRWYPGKVSSIREIGHGRYGPMRLYDVKFDDGDAIEALNDHWVFSKEDYLLDMKFKARGESWKGVMSEYDMTSSDEWAKRVGWYTVVVDDRKLYFSSLSDAMKAHDANVVRARGERTKRSDLNMPRDYPWLFVSGSAGEEDGEAVERVKVERKDPKEENISEDWGFGHTNKWNDGFDAPSDVDHLSIHSRFSDIASDDDGDNRDTSDGTGSTKSGGAFTQRAFMRNSLFHLNSFIDGKKKTNKEFGLFIKESVASPGFDAVPLRIANDLDSFTQDELRLALIDDGSWCRPLEKFRINEASRAAGARQIAMWHKNADIGSFIIMRHEYANCKFCPERLRSYDGDYLGPVYVIGMIRKMIRPRSDEETRISNRLGDRRDNGNLCLVDWKRMGYKRDLKRETWDYINVVCQPTVAQICQARSEPYRSGATPESVRRDIWENATTMIQPDDF